MRNIILAVVAVLVVGGGAAYYFTAGGGKGETSLGLVRGYLDRHNVTYDSLVLDGDVVRASGLVWTPNPGAAPVTAETLEIEDLNPAGLTAALPGGDLKRVVERATVRGVRFEGPDQNFDVAMMELRGFRGRDLDGFRRASNQDQGAKDAVRRVLSDVAFDQFVIESVHVEGEDGMQLDASRLAVDGFGGRYDPSALSPIVDRLGLEDLDVTSSNGIFGISLFELSNLKGRDWIGAVERLDELSESQTGEEAAPEVLGLVINSVGWDRFAFEDVSLEGVRTPDMAQGQAFDLDVGLFAIEDLEPGRMGAERLEDVAFSTGLGGGSLKNFRVTNVDYRWLPDLLDMFAAAETGETPVLNKAQRDELELNVATAADDFVMEGLEVSVMGMSFRMPIYSVTIDDGRSPEIGSQSEVAMSFGPTAAPLLPPPFRLLSERGVQTLELSLEGETRQHVTEDTLATDGPLTLAMPPLANATVEFAVQGYDPFASLSDVGPSGLPNPAAPYQNVEAESFVLTFEDSGLLDWAIEASALQQGVPASTFRDTLIAQARAFLAPSLGEPVATFLSDGGTLTLRLEPPAPTPLMGLQGALQQPESFGLTITRE